jgi:hypothetical protein
MGISCRGINIFLIRSPLVTLRDAALYITKLPEAEHDARNGRLQWRRSCWSLSKSARASEFRVEHLVTRADAALEPLAEQPSRSRPDPRLAECLMLGEQRTTLLAASFSQFDPYLKSSG